MSQAKSPRVHVRFNGHLECRHKLSVLVGIVLGTARAESEEERYEAYKRAREFAQDFFPEEL